MSKGKKPETNAPEANQDGNDMLGEIQSLKERVSSLEQLLVQQTPIQTPVAAPEIEEAPKRAAFPAAGFADKVRLLDPNLEVGEMVVDTEFGEIVFFDGVVELPYAQAKVLYETFPDMQVLA